MGDETLNKRLGDYELVGHIGDGAQGKIFKARCVVDTNPHVRKDEFVALKIVRRFGEDEKGEERFRREIKNFLSLKHPNLVEYREAFTVQDELSADLHCLVMEFLDGEDLRTRLQSYPHGLPFDQVKSIFEQALAGLVYARQNGLIHRDIKPSNLFLLSNGVTKVIDFGLARKEDGTVTTTAGFKGTYDYMAPDFLTSGDEFRGDEQSDVFSLGICFYQALTGKLPYATSKESGWVSYLNRWQKPKPQDLSIPSGPLRVLNDRALAFVRKSLRVDRRERYASFKEMAEDLRKVERRSIVLGQDRYDFQAYLGKGGFGEVFKAQRARDGRSFAVKHLFPDLDPSRFVREARLLQEYPHPNLVDYAGFAQVQRLDGTDYYLVLEFLEGMPQWGLRARIKAEGAMSIPEVIHQFTGYLEGLHHLHTVKRKPILHRDITPANLYAPPFNPQKPDEHRPKIFDLGIARSEQTMTGGHVPGNPEYMAPEFVMQPDFRGSVQSDLYCLGMCLYEAVTGKPAYPRLSRETAEMWNALRQRAEGKHTILFDLDVFRKNPALEKIIRKAIARDPRKRFESAAEMLGALKALGTPDEAKAIGSVEEAPPPSPGDGGGEVATVFVPDAPAAAASLRNASSGGPTRHRRIRLSLLAIAAVALVLLGLGGMWVKDRLTSPGDQVAAFFKSSSQFAPSAAYVATLRAQIEAAEKFKQRHPADVELARNAGNLDTLWRTLPARFDGAFQEAIDKGALEQARGILGQWEKAVRSLPFRDVTLSDHSVRSMSMKRRADFCEEYIPFSRQEPGASKEYAERLVMLLKRSDENLTTEVIPETKAWWQRQKDSIQASLKGFPGLFLQAFERALKNEKMVEAEAMVTVWKSAEALPEIVAGISAESRQRLASEMVRLVGETLEVKKKLAISAYAAGDRKAGEPIETWLRKCKEEAPSLIALAGDKHATVLAEIARAQTAQVMAMLQAVPVPSAESELPKAQAKFAEAESLFLEWSGRWPAADAAAVRAAGLARANGMADQFAGEAITQFKVPDYTKGSIALDLLKKFVRIVPPAFRDEVLQQKITEVTRVHDESRRYDKEFEGAIRELDRLAGSIEKEPLPAWKDPLENWGGVALQPKTREGVRNSEKWQNLTKVLELKSVAFLSETSDIKQLDNARAVLGMKELREFLGKDLADRMIARLDGRVKVLNYRERMNAIRGSIRADDPLSWQKGIEELTGTSEMMEALRADPLAYEMWGRAKQDCFDKLKEYIQREGSDAERLARLMKTEDVLALAKKSGLFDAGAVQNLDQYAAREKTRLLTAAGGRQETPPPVQPATPTQPVRPTPPTETPAQSDTPAVTVKPIVPVAPVGTSQKAEQARVDALLLDRRLRDALYTITGPLMANCRALARKDPKAVEWKGLLLWVQRKRDDNPGLNLIGREELNAVEIEIKRYADGGAIPPESTFAKPTPPLTVPEKFPATVPPAESPAKPPKPASAGEELKLSAALLKEVKPVEDLLNRSDFREAVVYMTGSLIKRCRRLEKDDAAAVNWEDLIQWVRKVRRDYPGLNVVGQRNLDGLENDIEELISRRRKGR